MRALILAAGACLAISTAACTPAVTTERPAAAVSGKVLLEGTRGLVLAHNAFQGAIAAVNPLVRSRVLSAAQVDRYEQLVDQGEKLFSGAGSALSLAERTAALLNVASEISRLAGK